MKLRRLLALVTALVMLFATAAFLTACGGNSNGGDNVDGDDENGDTPKVLRVGMECAYAPYNWTQADDSNGAVPISGSTGYAYGYDVMMAKYIADAIGYELEIYKYDWDALVMGVQSGTIDCAIAGQSITADRLELVDFTAPYYYASIVTLTKADSEYASATGVSDLAGATATSQLNTVWYDVCLPQIPDVDKLPAQNDAPSMIATLASGACDIIVTDMPTAMAATAVYNDLVLLDFTDSDDDYEVSDEEINIGISVQKGNTELLAAMNGALAELTVEDYTEMMNDAIAVQPLSE